MINVIFDATLICNIFKKNQARSGIFFVALNVLNEMRSRKDISLCLYFSPENYAEGAKVKRDIYPDLDYVQNMDLCPRLCYLNEIFWKIHGKIFHHTHLRKPFALGIVITQRLIKLLTKKRINIDALKHGNVYFSPAYCVPELIRHYKNLKSFIVLHDTIPFLFPLYCSGDWSCYLRNIIVTSRYGDSFFCVSKSTKQDFKKEFPLLTDENSAVITLAANANFQVQKKASILKVVKIKYNLPLNKRYVFSLCTIEPRKNLVRAVSTFVQFLNKNNIDDLCFVLGGGHWDSFLEELKKYEVSWNPEQIIRAGYIDDDDLPVLYSNAEWFVYTSQYEGFGLPPLEAMKCGCPVITSNHSSLPEVVGDAGIMIDWDSDEQHVKAYEDYYFHPELREANRKKGLERAKMFSWEKTVEQMVKFMKEKKII